MAKEIKFNVKLTVDGKEQLATATTNIGDLRKAVSAAVKDADKFRVSLLNWSQGVQAVDAITDTLGKVSTSLSQVSAKMNGLQQSSNAVTLLTDKTGDEMLRFRNSVQAVADYFGMDFMEVMQSANAMSKGFGVSIDEALSLIRDGLVSGANANGEFLDTIKEYPRYFKEAGLSAEDFVAISTNAAKQGVFSDKGVDVIKEGNLRIREMTKATADALNGIGISADGVQKALQDGSMTTFEVMQQVAAKLKELPASSSQVGTAIADIFGGPGEDAGLEYIKTLDGVKLSMDDVKAATNGIAEQQERQIKMQENVKNAMSSVIDLSKIYADVRPYIDLTAQIGLAAMGVGGFVKTLQAMNIQHAVAAIRAKTTGAAMLLCGVNANRAAAFTRVFSAALRSGAFSATALKIALRGLMSATVIGAALMAVGVIIEKLVASFDKAGGEAGEAAKGIEELGDQADTVKEAYDSTLKSTYSDLMSKYDKLRTAWQALSTEQQKITWIKNNQSAFNDLRLKINDVSDAENIFNGNTDAVVEAFSRRAKAAAYAAKLASLYEKQIELFDKKTEVTGDIAEDAKKSGRKAKAGDVVPEGWRNERYGSVGRDGVWRFSEQGAKLYSGTDVSTNPQVRELEKQINDNNQQIEETKKQIASEKLEADKWVTPTATITNKTKSTRTGKTDDKPAEKGSIAWYENRISDLHKRIENESNTDVARKYKTEIETLENELKNKKEAIGIDTDISIDRAVTNVERLQKELAEAKKSVTEDVSSKTNVERLQKEIEENKKQAYEKAGQEIERVQQNYEIGIIGKDETFKTIENINEKLKSIGVNPIKVNFKTNIELLQEKLNDAQKEFDEAITIEARVEAQAKINGIQAEIDEATKGKLTIEADVKPSYITQGSAEDKRQSYSNAQQKADRIQQDYEIGLIGKDEALSGLAELNGQITALGLKPVHIEVETEDLDRAKEKMRETSKALRNGWSGIKGIGDSIQGITDALESDGVAWEKITSVVDGVVQAFMGIKAVIDLVNMLTGATTAQAAAQNTQTMATTANTTATVAHTAATTADTTASALNTTTKSGEAVANATASGAKLPFPANIAAIAAGVAAVVAALAMVGSFSTGGIVGGSSPTGDKLIARVNSGEMILNKHQQMRMLKILNSSTAVSTGISQSAISNYYGGNITLDTARLHNLGRAPEGSLGGNVHFEIDGRKLVGVLANETRVSSKSGKRTNIRI